MSRWFRHYAGMMRDDKLVRAALKSKQSIERCVWVYSAILESAAEIDDDGHYEIDPGEIAWFLRCKEPHIEAILIALNELGRIDGERIGSWSKRQFKTDSSGERVKRHRAARREAGLLAQWQPSKELRHEIYAADGYACVYCRSEEDLTVDHKVPELRGGTNGRENLQTTCRKCNAKKRDMTHDEFIERNGVTVTVTGHRQRTDTEVPLSNDNGRSPADEESKFWADAKAFLKPKVSGDPGALVNKWLRERGKPVTLAAINAAQMERAVDPVAYCEGYFRRHASNGQPQPVVPL